MSTLIDAGYLVSSRVPSKLKDKMPAYQAYYQKLIDAAVDILGGFV